MPRNIWTALLSIYAMATVAAAAESAFTDTVPPAAIAQPPAPVPAAALHQLNKRRVDRNLTAMQLLGGLGAVSLVSGLTLGWQGDPAARSFHLMNAGWGAVNLGLAAAGGWDAAHTDPATLSLAQSVGAVRSLQGTLLLNAGLDLAYMALGLWMQERARRGDASSSFFAGAGPSLMVQGGALLLFDLGLWWLHQGDNAALEALVGN